MDSAFERDADAVQRVEAVVKKAVVAVVAAAAAVAIVAVAAADVAVVAAAALARDAHAAVEVQTSVMKGRVTRVSERLQVKGKKQR